MKLIVKHSIFLLWGLSSMAQHQKAPDKAESLKEIFANGEVEGHIRNYFMSTINEGSLKDYYTDAIGGSISFKTMEYKGFELGVKGIFTFEAFTSNLNDPDPTTGKVSKWEHELYDINDYNNQNDLDRLEELYVKYNFDSGYFTYGKLAIEETPLLNETDGRMKPFAFKGFWFQLHRKKHIFNISWLDRISPRGTVEWYSFNEAIGLSNNGFQPDGTLSDYRDKTASKGIASLQYETQLDQFGFRANHYYINHISNTSLIELDYKKGDWTLGLQYALQFSDSFQKSLDYAERYIQPGENGQVLSGQLAYDPQHWHFGVAYTRAFDTGRLLFPKELGRDNFFTSLSRSRLEGLGDVNVFTLYTDYDFDIDGLNLGLEVTEVFGPGINEFEFNKYNIDEYYQINTRLHYELQGFFEGLNFDVLYVYKRNLNNSDPVNVFNQSNLHQINFVTNYIF
ncbi:MAG: hypothetical protein ACTHOM_16715 [Allomuricauda sp.]